MGSRLLSYGISLPLEHYGRIYWVSVPGLVIEANRWRLGFLVGGQHKFLAIDITWPPRVDWVSI